jgi:S1-C subfamily serine protease
MATISDLSSDIAALVERCSGSVVSVDGRGGRLASGIVWSSELILTAHHVIEQEGDINVIIPGGTLTATMVGRDAGTDLAVLKTGGLKGQVAARGAGSEVRPGHLVLAVGRPGEVKATLGIVSGLTAAFRSWRGGESEQLIETTAELLPGFSGGPLVDTNGRVIGINSWNFGRGISRALPVETADRVVENLTKHGRIRRAYLGLGTQPVRLAEAVATLVGQQTALLVVTVEGDGPAARAGLLQGDTIVGVDEQSIAHLDDLFNAVRALEVGTVHRVRVVRAGETKELSITPGERPS